MGKGDQMVRGQNKAFAKQSAQQIAQKTFAEQEIRSRTSHLRFGKGRLSW